MADFLSPAWFERVGERLAEAGALGDTTTRLRLGQIVTDAPGGEVAWTVELGGGVPTRLEMGVGGADVVLIEDYETASRLVAGAENAALWREGRIKLRGDVSALLGASDLLAALAEVLGGV